MPAEPEDSLQPIPVELIDDDPIANALSVDVMVSTGVSPLPVEPIPVEALPVEALAVEPLSVEAMPVQPMPVESFVPPFYSRPEPVGPPRLVIYIGVWSIIVAGLCLVGGPIAALTMAGIVGMNNVRAAAVAMSAVAPLVSDVAEVVDPAGFAAADRAAIIEGLSSVRTITPAQQAQLDELLAESGRQIVKLGSPIDPAVVAAGVTSSGELGTFGMAGASVGDAPSYYVLGPGRLELTDHRAVFFPGDGQPALRAIAYDLATPTTDSSIAPALLPDEAIRSTMRNIARLNGGKPKAVQVHALLNLLRGSNQQVVVPRTDGNDPAAEVASASSDEDGTLNIETSHGGSICTLTVTPTGQVAASMVNASAASVGPSVAPTVSPPAGSLALAAVLVTAGVELLIAIYLLIIGILTIRRSRAGRMLHWIYVSVKIPMAISAIAAAIWLCRCIATGGNSWLWAAPATIGLSYPIALLFALSAKSVRAYYAPIDAPPDLAGTLTSAGTRSAPW